MVSRIWKPSLDGTSLLKKAAPHQDSRAESIPDSCARLSGSSRADDLAAARGDLSFDLVDIVIDIHTVSHCPFVAVFLY
jgi:hypothetical protein